MSNVVILPWRSEFGTMIMHYVRWANTMCALNEDSVVCTRKGLEALFPNAKKFYYDWQDVPDVQKNTKLLKSEDNAKYLESLAAELAGKYPDYKLLTPEKKSPINKAWDFTPKPRVTRGFSTDVVLAPRYRKYGEHRNFEHWHKVAVGLAAAGLHTMAIGAEETSVPNLPIDDASWRYDSLDACLEMMQNCKLVLCTESGMAHLAALAGAPLAIIYDKEGREAGYEKWPWNFGHIKSYSKNFCVPIIGGWNNPSLVVEFVDKYLTNNTPVVIQD